MQLFSKIHMKINLKLKLPDYILYTLHWPIFRVNFGRGVLQNASLEVTSWGISDSSLQVYFLIFREHFMK